jgi:hypothetical protein
VTASGTAPLNYQWSINGTNISRGTNASLTLTNIQTTDAGSYTVVVTNIAGSATSSVATLTVYVPPTITTQPQSQAWIQGQTAAFSVAASGTSPLRYRWNFNGANISGATNASLTLTNIQTTNAGSYSVVVTNIAGSATSTVAALTVYVPPTITNQPASQALILGQTAAFTVAASGTAPLNYQWSINGTNISRGTNASLTLTNIQTTNAGSYTVVVTNIAGSATSSVVTLTVYVPPTITTQPQSQAVISGQSAAFSVTASGTAPLNYQWSINDTNISRGTNASLTLTNIQTTNAGNYSVVVANAGGSVTSLVATLTVYVPPTIATQPHNQTVTQGQPATFTVAANGSSPFSYQWNVNGTNISGATNVSLTLVTPQATDAGSYSVVVTNYGGSVTSQVATLTVNVPAFIITQPTSQTVSQGQTATFTVGAGGTANLSYQWYFNLAKINGSKGKNATLALSAVDTNSVGNYTVVVNNSWGSVTSAVATLTISVPPTITTQPASQALIQGQTAAFTVTADGTAPFGYQWSINGTSISDETNTSLTLTNIQTTDAGSYAVIVTNIAGSATSSVATLTVYVPPTITTQPASQALIQGQTAAFTVTANGTAPFGYQWNVNGTSISDATNTSLTLTNIQLTDAGSYAVIVTNIAGSATSSVATLTVYVPPTITTQPTNQALIQGQTAGFTVTANGTSPFGYQWSINGTNISDATNTSLILTNIQMTDAGSYAVIVTNIAGSATSSVATLTVYVPPTITTQPLSQAVVRGQNVSFSVGAGGTSPFSYQWNVNGTNIDDATNAILSLTSVKRANQGNYAVLVTNIAGSVTSAVAGLTVYIPPTITNQPQNKTLSIGQPASFCVGAFGTATLDYQWCFNGTAMPGATNAMLTIPRVHATDTGNYTVVVTNIAGWVTSAAATLTVTNPAITLSAAACPSLPTSGFPFQVSVPAGTTYVILTSTDFVNWTPIATNVALTGNEAFTDTTATNCPVRYYRAMVQ